MLTRTPRGKGGALNPVAPIGIGTSLVLITLGAILKYAITEGNIWFLDIQATGTILLLVGILGLVIALVYTLMLNRRREPEVTREREYYDEPTRRRY
jgi:beta-lactamase regulating signal transducer with metallopeptidase domain